MKYNSFIASTAMDYDLRYNIVEAEYIKYIYGGEDNYLEFYEALEFILKLNKD